MPATIGINFLLGFVAFRRVCQPLIVLASLPFALIGSAWFIFLLGHNLSVATTVGFIVLAGLAAEFGVVTLVYLDQTIADRAARGQFANDDDLADDR